MLEQVELKIQELQKAQADEYYKKKEEDLRSWGLVSKKENGKVTPLVVTDEEYDALIKASNGVGKSGRNTIAVLLNALSIAVIVVAVIAGFVLEALADELGFVYMSIAFVVGIVFAAVLKGVAEAVRLLQQIVDDKPIRVPTEAARKTEAAAKPQRVVAVATPSTQQPVVVQEQAIVYQQAPQQIPQPMVQPVYQPVMYQQVPYQPMPQQPQYQAPYQPDYSSQRFEDGFTVQDNSPMQFGE
ncbi:MAG: hypothetical protein J6Q79_01200 [Clostridia bacterium]|nr:hypothetical protein [Clostridia bacterium]